MGQCMDRLVSATPREMWIDTSAAADAAFAAALGLADRYVEDPERGNMLGQLRHARLEADFRAVARSHGLSVASPHTIPKGGRYSVMSSGGIHIIRGNVQTHRGPPRPSRFRQQLASTNRWLSPLQPDFYMEVTEPARDRLCAVLVVTAAKRGNPSLPAWVGIGFPHHDLGSWVEIASVTNILALYHDVDSAARTPVAAPVEVRDIAVPRLKRDNGRG